MPLYKDWKRICEIPREHAHFMMALAALDTDTVFGAELLRQLRQYATHDEEQDAPIPLSILQAYAFRMKGVQGWGMEGSATDLFTSGACEHYNIPVRLFAGPEGGGRDMMWPSAPPYELMQQLRPLQGIGHVVTLAGQQLVVVENKMPKFICLAPAKRIRLDL